MILGEHDCLVVIERGVVDIERCVIVLEWNLVVIERREAAWTFSRVIDTESKWTEEFHWCTYLQTGTWVWDTSLVC